MNLDRTPTLYRYEQLFVLSLVIFELLSINKSYEIYILQLTSYMYESNAEMLIFTYVSGRESKFG